MNSDTQLFHEAFENSSVGICIADNKGNFIFVNKALCNMLGYSANELIGKNFIEITHPDDVTIGKETIKQISAGKITDYHTEKRYVHKNGQTIWAQLSLGIVNPDSGTTFSVSIIHDITQQKNLYDQLKLSEEKYRFLAENTTDVIWLIDINGIYKYVSPSVYQMRGYKPEELLNTNFETSINSAYQQKVRDYYIDSVQKIKQGIKPENVVLTIELSRKNGSTIWTEILIKSIFDNEQKFVGFLGSTRDISKRYWAEKSQRESENKLQSVIENLGEGVGIIDLNENFIFANKAAKSIFNFGDDIVGKNLLSFIDINSSSEVLNQTSLRQQGYSGSYTVKFINTNASDQIIRLISTPYINSDGEVIGAITIFRNITEEEKTKRETIHSLSLLKATFESTADALLVVDNNYNIIQYNHKFLRVWQVTEEFLQTSTPKEISDYFDSLLRLPRSFFDPTSIHFIDPELVSSDLIEFVDGRIYEVFSQPQIINNETVGRVWNFRDVTIRRKMERELTDNSLKLKTLINNLHGVIFSCSNDPFWTMHFISEGIEDLCGYKAADFIENKKISFAEIIDERDRAMVQNQVELALSNNNAYTLEYRIVCADGSIKWVHEKGRLIHNIIEGLITDITARKLADEQLLLAKTKSEESDRLKTAFLHNISHEIRTPMNSILGFAQFLNNDELPPEKRKRFTEIILSSAHQLTAIIDDVVDLAAIEAQQVTVKSEPVDISSMMRNIYTQYAPKAKERSIAFRLIIQPVLDLTRVKTDETKLIQIITNLLNNAFKFTPRGTVSFGVELESNNLRFYVKDTGLGISTEMQERVFERFMQANKTLAQSYGGMGLGLAICKAYVSLLGGSIGVSSEIAKGSEFYFTIPARLLDENENTTSPSFMLENINDKSEKIVLVAEDDQTNFLLISEMLRIHKLKFLRANNGMEAINICEKNPKIGLILMDIKMPGISGLDAAKIINSNYPQIPIVALTAYAYNHSKQQALEAGCVDYVTKPLSFKTLTETLKRYFHP